jgi:predicted RNA-binding Zn ribbon-like protein
VRPPRGSTRTVLPERVAGRLSLDFLNTVDPRHAEPRLEYLTGYPAVLDWAQAAGAVGSADHERLGREVTGRAADRALRRVLDYREALYRLLAAAIASRAVSEPDLALVNAVLREATSHHVLLPGELGGVRDGWLEPGGPEQMLWPVAVDAWDLLTEPVLARVKECPGDDGACGWLFLDTSRSGTRRWCDMRTCGNRAKARAHYTRTRG